MLFGSFLVVFLDRAVHGFIAKWTWSNLFTRTPGSVVVAVLGVIITLLFLMHVAALAAHEAMTNKSVIMRVLTYLGAVGLIITSLCAHAGTIPHSPDWFDGPSYFMGGLAFWFTINLF